VGGRDASTGRRSRPEGVTFQRGFDGATRREPEVGNSRPVRRRAAPTNGRLQNWEETASGVLALVVVLDQFPLNMFRGQPASFATEAVAREVADRAIAYGFDQQLPPEQRQFLYLPFMHSETRADQERSVRLYEQPGLEDNLRYAHHHRDLIRRFGRFPHRNAIFGRVSTPDELAYLASSEAFHG